MIGTRQFHFQLFIGLALLAAQPYLSDAKAENRKPNIVYIMSDELGYYELSCMGHPNFQTPNIDKLAAQGVRFTQALAGAPVCAPTRCCLMTGKHAGHTSVRSNGGGTPLQKGEETIASMLKKVGYAVGGFGKWGCGGRGSTGVPEKHGFDIFVGYYDQVHAHSFYPAYIIKNSEEMILPGNRGGRSGQTYSQYVIMDEAKSFIRANRDKPFFCYLPITPPHGMFDIPEDDPAWALFKDKPWPQEAKRYSAMVNMIDRQVGEVIALLEELNLRENTVVFFCGDNGGQDYFRTKERPRGFHGPNVNPQNGVTFRGHKGNLYEGGLRIPMIVNWPSKIKPDRVSDLLWYFPDVMPTVAELAGADAPKDTDGISIVPELLGETVAGREQEQHEFLYWEFGGQTAVRMGNWKAIQSQKNKDWELYDLSRDLAEKTSVAAQHPDLLAKMKAFAEESHEPAQAGYFVSRINHEKDRRAKWGDTRKKTASSSSKKVNSLPQKGLIPSKSLKLVRTSSESRPNGKLAINAIDGDPSTHWHTNFQGDVDKHPHELVIDLGTEFTIKGFRYMARQDGSWNGAIKDCEFYISSTVDRFEKLGVKTTFRKTRKAQDTNCPPTQGRYILIRVLSELNGGPWASISELGVIGE